MISIIIPAKNEEQGLSILLPKLVRKYPDAEIIVVNDGSDDASAEICQKYKVNLLNHPYSKGNGAAIKSGARAAKGEILVFMDADGQHDPEDIDKLLDEYSKGYDMVVAARTSSHQANIYRGFGNWIYNKLASLITGHVVKDLTSGFRIVNGDKFRNFIYLLPNGFSYPTTITMAFFRAGYSVAYIPIEVAQRIGQSHLKLVRDGARFFIIIFKIGVLYSPLKIFAPVSLFVFLSGLVHYGFTYVYWERFTNMSALLFVSSIIIFLIGLVSEQITTLMYERT